MVTKELKLSGLEFLKDFPDYQNIIKSIDKINSGHHLAVKLFEEGNMDLAVNLLCAL